MFRELQTDDIDQIVTEIRKALELKLPPAISIRKRGELFIATLTDENKPQPPT